MTKRIWLPKSETKATVDMRGNVQVWDEMVMELRPVTTPAHPDASEGTPSAQTAPPSDLRSAPAEDRQSP